MMAPAIFNMYYRNRNLTEDGKSVTVMDISAQDALG